MTPTVLYLVSGEAPNRTILCAGAGSFAVARIVESESVWLPPEEQNPEAIAARWEEIASTAGEKALNGGFEQSLKMVGKAAEGLGIRLD